MELAWLHGREFQNEFLRPIFTTHTRLSMPEYITRLQF